MINQTEAAEGQPVRVIGCNLAVVNNCEPFFVHSGGGLTLGRWIRGKAIVLFHPSPITINRIHSRLGVGCVSIGEFFRQQFGNPDSATAAVKFSHLSAWWRSCVATFYIVLTGCVVFLVNIVYLYCSGCCCSSGVWCCPCVVLVRACDVPVALPVMGLSAEDGIRHSSRCCCWMVAMSMASGRRRAGGRHVWG